MKSNGVIIIEGQLQGLSNAYSLGEAGIPVIVADTGNCLAQYSRYCDKFVQCPPYDSDELADFLIGLAKDLDLKGWMLLPSNDHAVVTLSRNKERLEKYFRASTPHPDVIFSIYNKLNLMEKAREAGVPAPATYQADRIDPMDPPMKFPVLTKGKYSLDFCQATGRKAFRADTPEELSTQLEKIREKLPLRETIIQEMIPQGENKTISFTAFCEEGEIKAYWMGAKLREHPVKFGTATCAKSVFVEDCLKNSVPLLRNLNYTGVCEVEYLKDPRDEKYKLIEINPRTWLWVDLAKACGVDFTKMLYHHANNEQPHFPEDYQTGKYWINPIADPVSVAQSNNKKGLAFLKYLRYLIGKNYVNPLAGKKEIKPAFFYALTVNTKLRKALKPFLKGKKEES